VAREHYTRAVGPEHERVADSMYNMSSALFSLGEVDEAAKLVASAVEIWSERLGADHPRTLAGQAGRAMFEWRRGDLPHAIDLLHGVIARRERIYGKDHTTVAQALMNIGAMQRQAGELERARASLERALDIRTRASSAEHPATAAIAGNLATVLMDLGELDAALSQAEVPVRVLAADGAVTIEASIAYAIRGEVYLARDELELAIVDLQRAYETRQTATGADHGELREPLALLALAEARAGRVEAARGHATRATTVGGGLDSADPFDRGHVRELLARTLWLLGDRDPARAAAQAARLDLGADGSPYAARVERIDAWLRDHP
jgi:tetratricopeptide (TPR) repeat protein